MTETPDWATFPLGVLDIISNKLRHPEDFAFFRCVCTPWREVCRTVKFTPWILNGPFMHEDGLMEVHRLGSEAVFNLRLRDLVGDNWGDDRGLERALDCHRVRASDQR